VSAPTEPATSAHERAERNATPMWDEVKRLMDEHGIEDVEDLHRRFLESSGRGLIPVSGRHRDKPVSLSEFCVHITGRHPTIYMELMRGFAEIFDLNFVEDNDEANRLMWAYVFGRPSYGVYPVAPWPNCGKG
jgi:hypothetical protein